MKTLVIYYSFSGNVQRLAQQVAEQEGAQLYQVLDKRHRSIVGAFFQVPAAIGQKPGKIQPIKEDLTGYERFIVMGPIWASHPAPPVNSIMDALPKGAKVEFRMASSGGESAKDKVLARAGRCGLEVTGYSDIKTGKTGS